MEEIEIKKETMTSLEIAEVTGKRHSDVMRAIRNMESSWTKICGRKFALTSQLVNMPNGGKRGEPCFELNKTECLYIATKFNDEARAKLVLRWEQLEKEKRNNGLSVPKSFSQALYLAAQQQEQIERLQITNNEQTKQINDLTNTVTDLQSKTDYLNVILSSKSTVTITQIAQDYGMSAKKMNISLYDIGIQHKVNDQWILYSKYLDKGYVTSSTIDIKRNDGTIFTKLNTRWTQKGRLFLYQTLKKKGVLPLIEK